MKITVTLEVDTMGWSEAVQKAPAEIVLCAKDYANHGIPAVIGFTKDNFWCVIWWNPEIANSAPMIAKIQTAPTSEPKS